MINELKKYWTYWNGMEVWEEVDIRHLNFEQVLRTLFHFEKHELTDQSDLFFSIFLTEFQYKIEAGSAESFRKKILWLHKVPGLSRFVLKMLRFFFGTFAYDPFDFDLDDFTTDDFYEFVKEKRKMLNETSLEDVSYWVTHLAKEVNKEWAVIVMNELFYIDILGVREYVLRGWSPLAEPSGV